MLGACVVCDSAPQGPSGSSAAASCRHAHRLAGAAPWGVKPAAMARPLLRTGNPVFALRCLSARWTRPSARVMRRRLRPPRCHRERRLLAVTVPFTAPAHGSAAEPAGTTAAWRGCYPVPLGANVRTIAEWSAYRCAQRDWSLALAARPFPAKYRRQHRPIRLQCASRASLRKLCSKESR